MTTPFFLHVGMPKSGSSTLQQAIFLQHPDIYYLGKDNHNSKKVPNGCRDHEVYQMLSHVVWKQRRRDVSDKERADYQRLVLDQLREGQVVVGSWEALADLRPQKFQNLVYRLQQFTPDARIMMCIRNPLTWAPSHYLQQLQGHFIKSRLTRVFKFHVWLNFDDWAAGQVRSRKTTASWLCQGENIRTAVDMLGRDKVGVFAFEQLQQDPEQFYRGIAAFMGIDPEKTVELAGSTHRNLRLTQRQVEFLESVDKSPMTYLRWRVSGERTRRRWLKKYHTGPGAKIEVSDYWREQMALVTRESNAWLQQEFGLPLESYGYPV